jgi:cobalamin biosynthesis protein CbiG
VQAGDLLLGIGCTRGASVALLERGIEHVLAQHGLLTASVRALASIDKKRDEPGLLALSVRRGWPLTFYSAAELSAASVVGSALVAERVGTPAVAEPAARLLSASRELLVNKTRYCEHGVPGSMTLAVARRGSSRHV